MYNNFIKNNSAISDIIGTLLIVVLVTVLASITALYVYGYLQTVEKPNFIDFTVNRIDPHTIEIINYGGSDNDNLNPGNCFSVTINGVDASSSLVSGNLNKTVGSSARYSVDPNSMLVITGTFKGDKQSVVYQQKVQ